MNCILSASSIFSLYILLLCSCRVEYSYARDTLKQGEWLTDNGTTLVSTNGTFELGFFNATGSASPKRYVGIWYHEWDQQTFVWVANRDNPVLNGSTEVSFGIAEDGNLQVWNTTGNVYWNTTGVETSSSTNRNLKLMDSGNLVLSDDDDQLGTSLWESFQDPTDTFLPGMKMDENLTLTSWKGDGDPGSGEFTFKQAQDGEGRYVISRKTGDYWRSWMSDEFLSSDFVANLLSNVSNCMMGTAYGARCPRYFSNKRLVMNNTGELQYWDVNKGNWSSIWREPEDECSVYNACGKFGSCNINNWPFICKCLPGFQPTYQKNWDSGDFLGGCTRNSTSYDNRDMFLSLKMMKVGNSDSTYKVQNETQCKTEYCLNNPQCQAYSYDTTATDKCLIWTSDLINLQEEYPNGGHNLFVRVAKSVIESTVRNCKPCGTNLIPYPLSTEPNCGDPMYFSFYCNTSSGQVSFNASSGTYRVANINPSTGKFVIQIKHTENRAIRYSKGSLLFNQLLPFNVTSRYFTADDVEVSWKPPPEPTCSLLIDCKDWPNSTCNITRDGKSRCLCNGNFRWNGSNLNCTEG